MNTSLEKTLNNTFLQLIEDLKTKDEIEIFFKDLLGEKEYKNIVKKLALIYWLRKKRPKDIIKNNLGVSDKEIVESEKQMDKDGIKLGIKYLEAEEFANIWSSKIKKFKKVIKSR